MPTNPIDEKPKEQIEESGSGLSEFEQMEDALRSSEEKYSRLFHSSNDAILVHDLDGGIVDANQAALDLLGYTKTEIETIGVSKLHPADDLATSKSAFETIMRDGVVKFEIEFFRRNGEQFSAEVSSSLFKTGGSQLIQGIVRDISDRKRAEAAVRESEEKYKLLAEHSADVIYKLDIATEQYSYVSPSIEKMLGYTAEEALSLKAWDTVTEASYVKQREKMAEAISSNRMTPEILELEAVHKDGHTLPVETHANFIVNDQGSPVGILGVVRDISKQKQLKEEREKLIKHLQEALEEIKALRGILPVCSFCKRVRDDKGYWEQVDVFLQKYSLVDISHSICPQCMAEHYPEIDVEDQV